jgi:hypothetical protein
MIIMVCSYPPITIFTISINHEKSFEIYYITSELLSLRQNLGAGGVVF